MIFKVGTVAAIPVTMKGCGDPPRYLEQDERDMESNHYLAALTVVGLAMVGSYALADEMIVVASAKVATTQTEAPQAEASRSDIGREATLAATEQAVAAVLKATKKDLDIRFFGTTSAKATGGE